MDIKESTARKLFNLLYSEIKSAGEEYEQKSKLYWLLEDKYGINKTAIVADQDLNLSEDKWWQLNEDISKLKKGYPVQHLTNKSEFYGYTFFVNEDTLIPRPETEELVDLIIKENKDKKGIKILDIGTGSGCIPIVLDLELLGVNVWATDVSEKAIEIAKVNNDKLGANVQFRQHDIMSSAKELPVVDILISNPPYVPESEKEGMQKEVLDHEPHVALFSPEDDPLYFYRRIAEVGKKKLIKGGRIYFEIHENYGQETADLLKSLDYQNIRLIKDIHNKDRILTGNL